MEGLFEQQDIHTDQPDYDDWAQKIDQLVFEDEAQGTNPWALNIDEMFPDERPGMDFPTIDGDLLTSLVDNFCTEEKEEKVQQEQKQQLLQKDNNLTPMSSIDEKELRLQSVGQEAEDNYPQPDREAIRSSKDGMDNNEAEPLTSPLNTSRLAAELNALIGKTPDIFVVNYNNPFYLPKIMDSLRSHTSRSFNRMPHLLFVKGCDDDVLSAVACNPKEARDLVKVHLENQAMEQLDDVEARQRLEMVGRETKLARPPRCNPRYSSVVLNSEAYENRTLEPIQISTTAITNQQQQQHQKKKESRTTKKATAAQSDSSRTKLTIPANKKGSYTYEIQMAVPIPVQLDETDSDDAVNLISKETGEVVQARLFPYLMTVKFGSINERVTITDPSERLKTFVREKCQLPCLLNDTADVCEIAFPTKNFGNVYSFKLGEYNEIMQSDHQEVTKRSSLLTASTSTVTKTKVSTGSNDHDHDILKEKSLAGGIARFVNACYPSLLSSVPASTTEQPEMTPNRTASIATNLKLPDIRTRTCLSKINTVEETLSSMDPHSKSYVETLEKKTLMYESVKDEYKDIVKAKEEIIKQNITLNQDLQTVVTNQNFVIENLRRDIDELKSLKQTLKAQVDALRQDAASAKVELERERDEFDQVVQRKDKLIEQLRREKEQLMEENDALKKELQSVKSMCVKFEEKFNYINKKMESFEKRQEHVDTFMTNSKRTLEENEPSNAAKKMKFNVQRTVPVTVEA